MYKHLVPTSKRTNPLRCKN